jgi:hypothetical protein
MGLINLFCRVTNREEVDLEKEISKIADDHFLCCNIFLVV